MRVSSPLYCLAVLLAGAGLAPGALAQQPRPPAQAPDPAMEAAQRAFDALPEAERKAIQDDLIWASDFTATVSGSFGKRTNDAILSFKRAAKLRPDAVLDDNERKLLAEAARRARAAARYARVVDARTGAALGVPAALFAKREPSPTGTRWTSADGSVVLQTVMAKGTAEDLPAAFERLMSADVPGRKVTYKLLRPEFFVIAGETGGSSFYTRFGIGTSNLSGYSISYPTPRAKALERTVIALANSFEPVAAQGQSAQTPVAPANPAAPPASPTADPGTIPAGPFLTGLVVASGKLATAQLAAECPALLVNGQPAKLASVDKVSGLALIDAETGTAPALSASAPGPASATSEDVIVVGYVGSGKPVLTVSSGHLLPAIGGGTRRIEVPLHREAGGSAVFSRSGATLGLLAAPRAAPRLVAGIVPAVSHALVAVPPSQPGPAAAASVMTSGAVLKQTAPSLLSIHCAQPVRLSR